MIKENEIRLGNYFNRIDTINDSKLGYMQWDPSDWYRLGECIDYLESYEPIPLDEDILLRLGFKLAIDEHVYVLHDTIELTQTDHGNSLYFMGNFIKSDVKHIHELQNLVYSLTNEELNINF